MGSSESKKAGNSIQAQKIKEFFSYYGYKSGPQIQSWIDTFYSENFYGSTTLNYGEPKTITNNKSGLPAVYERALKGKYRPHSIEFLKVEPKSRTLFYKWVNNTPHISDNSKRVEIPFESYALFDQEYKILKVVHNHVPLKKVVNEVQTQRKGYWEKALDRASDNMEVVNNLLSQNYYPDPNSQANRNFQESQKRFRDNQNKQKEDYNNWARAQNNRYY